MIDYIKAKLLEDPEKIKDLLDKFEYCHITIRPTYISFGRDEESSPKSIVLYLQDNDALIVKDFATNQTKDIFNYIISNRSVSFKEVITAAKNILGIDGYYYRESAPKAVFNGFYAKIKNRTKQELKVYDESILNKYVPCGNLRFLKDHISLAAQQYFNIRYSVEDQAIVIPIYNETGGIMGIKARRNEIVQEGQQKYFYITDGCQMSQTLYNYAQSYEFLEGGDIIYVVESEKGCMQAWSYGYKNFVGLGSGSISRKQVQLLLSLNPKKIVFLHDVGFCLQSVMRNIEMVKGYCRMKDITVGYWDYFGKDYEDKISPTDKGKGFFEHVINNEIKYVDTNRKVITDEESEN